MESSWWIGVAVVLPGLLAGGISWAISHHDKPAAPKVTFREVCGTMDAWLTLGGIEGYIAMCAKNREKQLKEKAK